MAKRYYATTPFIDASQKRIKLHQRITSDDYDEVTIKHYLHHGMIHPGNPPKKKGEEAPKGKGDEPKADEAKGDEPKAEAGGNEGEAATGNDKEAGA